MMSGRHFNVRAYAKGDGKVGNVLIVVVSKAQSIYNYT